MRGDEMCGNTIGMRRDVPGNARKIAKAARKRRAAFFSTNPTTNQTINPPLNQPTNSTQRAGTFAEYSPYLNYDIICRCESLFFET